MRRFSLSVLLVAICLLPVGIGSRQIATNNTDNENRRIPTSCLDTKDNDCSIGSRPPAS